MAAMNLKMLTSWVSWAVVMTVVPTFAALAGSWAESLVLEHAAAETARIRAGM
jgi:hypothetical protein